MPPFQLQNILDSLFTIKFEIKRLANLSATSLETLSTIPDAVLFEIERRLGIVEGRIAEIRGNIKDYRDKADVNSI